MTLRRQALDPCVTVTPNLLTTNIRMPVAALDLTAMRVLIKRADGTDMKRREEYAGPKNMAPKCPTDRCGKLGGENPWLIEYPVQAHDGTCATIQWDDLLQELPPGQYVAEIQIDCQPCHRFGLVVPNCPRVARSGAVSIDAAVA